MDDFVAFSPEELYFLGELLHADYLDYAYIAAMDSYCSDPMLADKDVKSSLVSRNIITEDFSGEVAPNGEYLSLLDPVFFGKLETSVDVYDIVPKQSLKTIKFHFLDENITTVRFVDGAFIISKSTIPDIVNVVRDACVCVSNDSSKNTFAKDKIDRVIAFKRIVVGYEASVFTAMRCSGAFYTEISDSEFEAISIDELFEKAIKIVKGD